MWWVIKIVKENIVKKTEFRFLNLISVVNKDRFNVKIFKVFLLLRKGAGIFYIP